jgi:hypothetical protein
MRATTRTGVAAWTALTVGLTALAAAQTPTTPEEATVTHEATGTFDVKLTPQTAHSSLLGRMTIDKQLHGDLEAESVGEMVSAMGAVQGSAGYVAMEVVRGTLNGRSGSFVLQHSATMNRGVPTLSVTVVPDSGTDGLAGISGRMTIIIEGKDHSYRFEYSLPS